MIQNVLWEAQPSYSSIIQWSIVRRIRVLFNTMCYFSRQLQRRKDEGLASPAKAKGSKPGVVGLCWESVDSQSGENPKLLQMTP